VDHYEALGVPDDADPAEIRRAYLASARRHHPDFHAAGSEAERSGHAARMKAVTEAWHVLGDVDRRHEYDRRRGAGGTAGGSGVDVPPGKGWTPRAGDDAWMDDFGAWAGESDDLLPDEDEPEPGPPNGGAVLVVGLFVASILVGFFSMVFESRAMLAASAIGVVASSLLFVLLPFVAMTRHRRRSAGGAQGGHG